MIRFERMMLEQRRMAIPSYYSPTFSRWMNS